MYFSEMDAVELKFANAFNSIPNIGSVSLRLLKNHFGSFAEAWRAGVGDLQTAGLNQPALAGINWKRPATNPDREIEKLFKEDIWLIDEEDEKFPPILKEIPSQPLLIYGRGNLGLLTEKNISIGVVGTRKPTSYGIEATEKIVSGLVRAGITIVSGLASGIDSEAHETALAGKGKTIAVLGCGVDHYSIFPPENKSLARKIAESGGVVLSEYSPGTPAVKEHFPQRNRIISGLSKGVLVVEARERSGALITSRLALDQNREVFAVPGSIFSLASAGPNQLIAQGAKAVTCAKDILDELGLDYTEAISSKSGEMMDEKEWTLLQLLEEPLSVDVIKEKSGLETGAILSSLSMLELKGIVKNMGGNIYQKI